MSGDLDGRRVVVTGAASGIGRAVAAVLLREGAHVVLLDRDGAALDRTCAGLGSAAHVEAAVVDLGDEAQVTDAASGILATGRVDVLVNQAGIIRRGDVRTQSLAQWEEIQRSNVTSMFLLTRALMPSMLEAGGGAVVNCSSGAAFESGRGLAAYSASKGAVVAFTRSLAVDYGPTVRANAVCPGLIDTPGAYVDADDEMRHDRAAAAMRTPLQRMGTPDEVAEAVLFLASDRSAYCSGIALMVDGGKLAGA